MPARARAIENVNDASMIRLRSTMLSERARARATGGRRGANADASIGSRAVGALRVRENARGGVGRRADDGGRNAGVDARAAADREARVAGPSKTSRGVREALERKAEAYERLVRGEDDDFEAREDERVVDFAAKADARRRERDDHDGIRPGMGMMSDDMRRELERREWERGVDEEEREKERAAIARRVVFDIERETERERDARDDAKRQREDDDAARRERLKAKFLRDLKSGRRKLAK